MQPAKPKNNWLLLVGVIGATIYTALGHKLRYFRRWKAQFMTVGIIYFG
jgi:hypothetical protein